MRGIVQIDMHIRDQRVLDFFRTVTAGDSAVVTYDQIAEAFACHRNTAQAIVARLERAKMIEVDKSVMRGGYRYRVIDCQ